MTTIVTIEERKRGREEKKIFSKWLLNNIFCKMKKVNKNVYMSYILRQRRNDQNKKV